MRPRILSNSLLRIVNRVLFYSQGKLCDVEEYLRPIIMERLERGTMDEADHDPASEPLQSFQLLQTVLFDKMI